MTPWKVGTSVVIFYLYGTVPPKVYSELMAAQANGRYMKNEILDVYPSGKLSRHIQT
jgi:hypothetical protein